MLSLIFISRESTMVNTEIMAKIPIVIPSNDNDVLSLIDKHRLQAKI